MENQFIPSSTKEKKKKKQKWFSAEMNNYIDVFIFSTIRVDHLEASLSPMSKIHANNQIVNVADFFYFYL